MSEKRFTMEYSFEDEEYVFFDGDVALTPSETVKLLNEQQFTIQSLKEENEQLRILLNEAEDMIETRLAEHYIKQYKNIKKGILDE